MKSRLFFFFLTVLTMSLSGTATAQEYQNALGLRLGYPLSVSYKHFVNDNGHALEGYLGFRDYRAGSWVNISGAYQVHRAISEVDRLYFYYGGGASLVFWNYNDNFPFDDDYARVAVGLQGYLGLDYNFKDAPVNVSLDWVPTFFLRGYSRGFGADYGSLSVRYILD